MEFTAPAGDNLFDNAKIVGKDEDDVGRPFCRRRVDLFHRSVLCVAAAE